MVSAAGLSTDKYQWTMPSVHAVPGLVRDKESGKKNQAAGRNAIGAEIGVVPVYTGESASKSAFDRWSKRTTVAAASRTSESNATGLTEAINVNTWNSYSALSVSMQ